MQRRMRVRDRAGWPEVIKLYRTERRVALLRVIASDTQKWWTKHEVGNVLRDWLHSDLFIVMAQRELLEADKQSMPRRYRITQAGIEALEEWSSRGPVVSNGEKKAVARSSAGATATH